MGLVAIAAAAAVGVAVGLLSGLVGIGGGVLIVPFLYFFFDHPQLSGVLVGEEMRTVLAHGTSLFVIVPTAARGAWVFHRSRLVEWRAALPIGFVAVVAATVGTRVALALPPELLEMLFGVLLIASGVRLALRRPERAADENAQELRIGWAPVVGTGVAVGLISSTLGVGGGMVAIPLLIHLIRVDIRRVAGTSVGIITITALAGVLSYVWAGAGAPGLPSGAVGFVHVPVGIAMFVGSVAAVRWGALLNQRLRPRALTLIFGGLFVVLGSRLVLLNGITLVGAVTRVRGA